VSTPDPRQALAALALGVLPADEARKVEDRVQDDAVLSGELEDYRATVRALERVLPREPAPAHLFAAGRKLPRAWSLPSVRLRHVAAVAAATALVTALVVGVVVFRGGGPDADARAEIIAAGGGPARGEALLYDTHGDDARLVLRLSNVPTLEPGHHYQVWVLRVGGETMQAVGVFSARGEFEHEFRLPGPGRYAAVDVSVEEDVGDAEHSGRSLGAGPFT
jgi:anti-sigma-K factor RskA